MNYFCFSLLSITKTGKQERGSFNNHNYMSADSNKLVVLVLSFRQKLMNASTDCDH